MYQPELAEMKEDDFNADDKEYLQTVSHLAKKWVELPDCKGLSGEIPVEYENGLAVNGSNATCKPRGTNSENNPLWIDQGRLPSNGTRNASANATHHVNASNSAMDSPARANGTTAANATVSSNHTGSANSTASSNSTSNGSSSSNSTSTGATGSSNNTTSANATSSANATESTSS
jgi:hypothetical protein